MVIDAQWAKGMMVAGFFMIIDARWANQRIRLMKFPFFSP